MMMTIATKLGFSIAFFQVLKQKKKKKHHFRVKQTTTTIMIIMLLLFLLYCYVMLLAQPFNATLVTWTTIQQVIAFDAFQVSCRLL